MQPLWPRVCVRACLPFVVQREMRHRTNHSCVLPTLKRDSLLPRVCSNEVFRPFHINGACHIFHTESERCSPLVTVPWLGSQQTPNLGPRLGKAWELLVILASPLCNLRPVLVQCCVSVWVDRVVVDGVGHGKMVVLLWRNRSSVFFLVLCELEHVNLLWCEGNWSHPVTSAWQRQEDMIYFGRKCETSMLFPFVSSNCAVTCSMSVGALDTETSAGSGSASVRCTYPGKYFRIILPLDRLVWHA